MSIANVSQHLQVLRRAQMVEVRRAGVYAFYRLADERVFRLWQAVRAVGEIRLAEIERVVAAYLKDRATLEPVTVKELARPLDEGDVVVIDPSAEGTTAVWSGSPRRHWTPRWCKSVPGYFAPREAVNP